MNLLNTFFQNRRRRRTMDSLAALDDHMLRDIGFERDQLGRVISGRDLARLQDLGR